MYLPNDDLAGTGNPISFMPSFMPLSSVQKSTQNTSLGQDFFYFSLPKTIDRTQVKVGVQVTLVVVIGRKDSTLLLAPAAIRNYRGQNFVIIIDGDRRRRVEINQIGLKTTDKWEVIGDLKEGDKVQGP